ncbi:filamentous hemagglutinin N-terminal domain-containing protein [Nostoc sp. CENA67]|uniref:Filamentous hemagglutinin N-terminal domain-containing protein n=1 Tax=Amazonocrinis nigriterrae CENA67 TaxID=2794033 RepID=A0A8J7HZB6_9NOST|nr:filamentous hemagglutinin N-terminal domain-containing protein [Amazonocrinis nigriterrae]MBH8567015.1 filamentous hemagglutinin N-terminal domain-containing protein [Amazonocrinis nigriterrae CENA67]
MQHAKRSLLFDTLRLPLGVNFVLALLSCIAPWSAKAQITPDTTLGDQNSVVVPDTLYNSPIDRINGGAIRGNNLFHSFQEFNVGEGARAYFTNPGGITNIFTRVTGSNPSNILGTLGVLGNANFFLINPHGIVFGPNARLDVGGSFVASSADSLLFDNGLEFSATNPQAPLLTVNIPVALQLRQNPASIVNQSSAVLALQPTNTLALVGGNVVLDGGSLQVSGGRIELGGLTGAGTVGLNIQESQGFPKLTSLSFPDGVERADVSLSKEAVVNVAAGGGGSIVINGRNVNIVGGGRLFAGISQGNGSPGTQAGNIEINATDQVVLSGVSPNNAISGAYNQVETGAQGNSGDIKIQAGSFAVSDGGQLNASTTGKGNAGTIRVTATNQAVIDGQSVIGQLSSLLSQVRGNGEGNSGGIEISAGSVEITNGGLLDTNTLGRGDSGKIRISATGQVLFAGESRYNNLSQIHSQVEKGAVGNSGGIEINAGSVAITKGAQLSASTSGQGNAGKISITAGNQLLVDGESLYNYRSTIFSQVGKDAVGNSGGIDINAGSVAITNGAQLGASTSGQGDAGKINITAGNQVMVDGESSTNFLSTIFSQVEKDAVGNSGGIEINAGSVAITKGGQLSASTSGQGDAGKINITAGNQVLIDGESLYNFRSTVFSQVEKDAVGNSGGIEINAGSVAITKGGQLSASTSGQGDAGKISITAGNQVMVDGESSKNFLSTVFSQVEKDAVGNSGGIEINAGNIAITNGAQLGASTSAQGDAGKITITAGDRLLVDGESLYNFRSTIFSQVEKDAVGNSGGIEINAPIFELMRGALVDASTKGSGNAGTTSITATDQVIFDGESTNGNRTAVLSQVFDGAFGKSGGIVINTPVLEVTQGAFLDASTKSSGDAGAIRITATGKVIFDGESSQGNGSAATSQVTAAAIGNSGGIEINTPIFRVTNGAQINTNTLGKGNSGAIRVTATDSVVVDGTSSDRFLSSALASEVGTGATGASKGITINTPRLQISNTAFLSANTNGNGDAGNIDITANTIELSSGGQIRTNTSASSKAGDITLNVPNSLTLSDLGTAILAQTENTSSSAGGSIFVIGSPQNVLIQNGAELSVNSKGSGTGGDIFLQANSLTLDQGTISAETSKERGGNITLQVADLLLMQDESKITTNAGTQSQPGAIGTGGNIAINTEFLIAPPSKPNGSDITANATYGDGGRVDITATGIYGIEFRDKPRDFFNDITASSEFGGNPGVVNINEPIDPSRNLVELPANVIDPNDQIAQNPCSKGVGSEFTITGRGGLPPSPNEDLSQEATQVGLVEPVSTVSNVNPVQKTSASYNSPSQIVPAQGWVFNNQGEIVLTAYNPNVIGTHRLPKNFTSCPAR